MAHPRFIFYIACIVGLMSTIGAALPYPILAPIFVDAPADNFNHFLGLPPKLLLGLALAINPFGILLGSMVLGRLSDRFGRRRVLMISLFLTVLGHVATAIALQQRWYVLFVLARFATGVTEGNIAVLRAIIADLHPALDRNQSFATFNSWLYMGWLLGPMAGGFALPLGASVPFWLAAAIIMLCTVLLWRALPPDVIAQAESLRALFKVMRTEHALSLLKDPAMKQIFYLQLLITLGVNAFYEFYPLWLVEFARFDSIKIALATACMCLVMSVSSSVLPRLIGSERPLSQARLAALTIALGLIVQPWFDGWPGVALIILLGVPISLYNAIAPAYFSEHFGANGQGQIMGLLTTTFCLGNVIIALLGSVLTLLDTRLILVTGGLCYLAAVVMLGRWITGRGPLGKLALEA